MKKKLTLAASFIILFFTQATISSCSKSSTTPPEKTTVAGLLMGKEWIVDSLFYNYTPGSQGTSTRVYTRGSSNNVYNLDNYIVIFLRDGTQLYSPSPDSFIPYSYSFLSADSLNMRINNPNPDYARIVKLDANSLTLYDSTNSGISYYKLKP